MYPLGIHHAEISLHIRLAKFQFGGEGDLESQNPKCQDLPKFQFPREGGCSGVVKTQSAKICLNVNLQWG